MKTNEIITTLKKALSYIEKDMGNDKCRGYAPGCANCQAQILIGYLEDYIGVLEYEKEQV